MERIEDLEAFVAVVEQGGLTAAARRLGRTLQAVSRSLATLEQGLGVELVRRTTRRSGPTEAGQAFYRRIKPALAEIAEARAEASERRAEPAGRLRIGASVLFAPVHVVPVVAAFMQRHQGVEVDLVLSDRFADLGQQDLDLAVRIGDLPDSALTSRRLGALRRVVFGAPAYFAQAGRPQHPRDLASHQCVVRTIDGTPEAWPFRIDGRREMVKVSGRIRADATAAIYAAVAAGLGLGFTPLWQIHDLVDRGAVELVLTPFEPPTVPIHAVWPSGRLAPAKTRAFVEMLADHLRSARL